MPEYNTLSGAEVSPGELALGEFARQTLAAVQAGTVPAGLEVPVQALAIGQDPCLHIVGLPGEPLSTVAMAGRDALPSPTMVLG